MRRPQEELDALLEQARQNWIRGTGSSEGFSWQPPEYYPSLASMMVDGDGRLWVRDGAVDTLFHVFSGSGQYLFDCPLVMPGWQESGGWSVQINSNGIVASPRDPESYPILYMMEEVVEVIQASENH